MRVVAHGGPQGSLRRKHPLSGLSAKVTEGSDVSDTAT